MSTFRKLSRVVKSNINDLLDSLDAPDKTLKQLIHDLKDTLKEAEIETERVRKEDVRLASKHRESASLASEWDEKVVLALKNKNDGLAKEALKKKKQFEAQAQEIRSLREQHKDMVKILEEGLENLKNKLKEMENKKSILVARQRQASAKKLIYEAAQEIEDRFEPCVLLEEAEAHLQEDALQEKFTERYTEEDLDKELQMIKQRM